MGFWNCITYWPVGNESPSLVVGRSANGPQHVLAVQLNFYQRSAWDGTLMEGNRLMGIASQTLRGSGEVVMLEKDNERLRG